MNLEISLNQKMSFSPQMQQSMEVLQMGTQELLEYISQLTTENPVVEVEEPVNELDRYELFKRKLEWLDSKEEEHRVYYQESEDGFEEGMGRGIPGCGDAGEEDLYRYLQSQLNFLTVSKDVRKAARYMIGCIDENGYLDADLEKVAQDLAMEFRKVEEALRLVQSLEPAGVGARNLKECLFIQLERRNIRDALVHKLIDRYLELLSKNQLEVIAKEAKVSVSEIKEAYKMIRRMNPRPGMGFDSRSQSQYLTPDVTVVKFRDYYEVLLNDYLFPKISINRYYRSVLEQSPSKEVKDYINNKIKEADWAMKCIDQRNATLIRVAEMIVNQQRKFFDAGAGHLVPMNLRDISEALGIHESTVSRSIRGKYLQCAWGTYGLDYFFTNGLTLQGDSRITPENVKIQIKDIIGGENRKKPYSDQQITDLLTRRGVAIARRTVAKYREELNIPGASGRKEYE